MTLAEQLNLYGVWHDTIDGELMACPKDDTLFDEDKFVSDPGLKTFLDRMQTFKCWQSHRPGDEAADLVSYASTDDMREAAWYDQETKTWIPSSLV